MKAFFITASLLVIRIAPQTLPQSANGSIEGIVVVAGTSRPIAGAQVTLGGPPSNRPEPTTTVTADKDGRFAFRNLPVPAAYYGLRAQHDGYNTVESGLGVAEIRLGAGENVRNVVLTLTTGGNIRGRISDPAGRPVSNVPIYVYLIRHEWDGRRGWIPQNVAANGSRLLNVSVPGAAFPALQNRSTAEPIAQTNADGTFLLRSIPAGEYYVGVEYGANPDGFASTYYPGVVDSMRASLIVVEPESNIDGIDFRIQSPPRFKLSGQIENLNTNPTQPLRLVVRPSGSDGTIRTTLGSVSVNPVGSFEVTGIVPGSYELVAIAGEAATRLSVEVRDKNIEGLLLRIPRTVALQGNVRIEPRPGSAESPMPIGWSPVSENVVLTRPFRLTRDGPFSIANFSVGTYYLSFIDAPSGYTLDIHQGSRDVRNNGRIIVGANSDPLNIVVRPADFGSIQGTVTTAEGKTLWSQVLLVPDKPRRENHALYIYDSVKWGGRIELQNITPGSYRIFAWEKERNLGLSPYMDASTLTKYEMYGVPITVRPNEVQKVEVPLIP
jgi:carboxypeptidase family protein